MLSKGRRQTILLIDREREVNELLRSVLGSEGYYCLTALNLDSAVHLLSTVKVDLVITDYMESTYRRGNRWPILEMFKQLVDPGTPFIVLTGDEAALRRSAVELGVALVVPKPFDLERLAVAVADTIKGRQR